MARKLCHWSRWYSLTRSKFILTFMTADTVTMGEKLISVLYKNLGGCVTHINPCLKVPVKADPGIRHDDSVLEENPNTVGLLPTLPPREGFPDGNY
jgi:hypothetical protein